MRETRRSDFDLSANMVVVPTVASREIAQRYVADVVLAAAIFKPNASGAHSLSWKGFGQRQVLKSCGAYLCERALIAVTPLDVHAIESVLHGRFHRHLYRWLRADIQVTRMRADDMTSRDMLPAVRVATRSGRPLADIRPLHDDDETRRVCSLLLVCDLSQ